MLVLVKSNVLAAEVLTAYVKLALQGVVPAIVTVLQDVSIHAPSAEESCTVRQTVYTPGAL